MSGPKKDVASQGTNLGSYKMIWMLGIDDSHFPEPVSI
jgi:hypothetical protein